MIVLRCIAVGGVVVAALGLAVVGAGIVPVPKPWRETAVLGAFVGGCLAVAWACKR